MPWLSLDTLRPKDWCSHLAIYKAVSITQSCSSSFSMDRCWFRLIWLSRYYLVLWLLLLLYSFLWHVLAFSIWIWQSYKYVDLVVLIVYVCPYLDLEVLDPYSLILPSLGIIEVIIPTILWLASVGFIVHYLHPSNMFLTRPTTWPMAWRTFPY